MQTWPAMIRKGMAQHSLPKINLLAGFVLLVLFCGCVEVEQTLTLKSDGSGLVDITYAISEDQAARLQAMASGLYEDEEDRSMGIDASDEEIRNEFKEYEAHGVVLQSVKTASRAGQKQRRLVIAFQSLDGLAQSGFLSDRNVSLLRNAQGDYVFTQAGGSNGDELMTANEIASDPLMAQMMKGFKVTLRIRTPSRIVQTNAPEKDEQTAVWRFDLDSDPAAVDKVARLVTQVTFEGRGLNMREFRSGKGGGTR